MLMLDRRMLLRAGSAAVGATALVPTTPALANAATRIPSWRLIWFDDHSDYKISLL
jgi:hypothetical protein